MATRRYSIDRGEHDKDVTEAVGAAIATKKIELTVDLASSLTRSDVLVAIKQFERWIIKGSWPPA